MRTILFLIYLGIQFLFSMVTIIPAFFLWIAGQKKSSSRYIHALAQKYARNFIKVAGARVEITGLEKLPETDSLCFVSNHQGIADIPLIVGWIPKPIGFIAKKELKYIPTVNVWIKALGGVFIDRKNPRKSKESIEKGAISIRNGSSVVIFPEGTRARSNNMGKFKQGSLKLALQAQAVIVPVTIINSFRLFEETGRLQKSEIKIFIHDPVDPSAVTHENLKNLIQELEETVRRPLTEYHSKNL